MSNKEVLFLHAQTYIREVMADRLRAEGFVSYKGHDIHWYRLVNNEVVQAIYFVTRHTALHSSFEICYGCHPLYIPPVFQKSPYMYGMPCSEQMGDMVPERIPGSTPYGVERLFIYGLINRPYRVPDALIMCPKDKNNGLDILELVLPVMDTLNTPITCYEHHKWLREGQIERKDLSWFTYPSYFVDEVLFWDDKALYEVCQKYLKSMMNMLAYHQKNGIKIEKILQAELQKCVRQDEVFRTGNRQEYLETFHEREQQTLRMLRKYCDPHT